jgi:hypothetical protein
LWSPQTDIINKYDSSLAYDATPSPDIEALDHITLVQQEGETMFVPSGWYHTVENLDATVISVNKNW